MNLYLKNTSIAELKFETKSSNKNIHKDSKFEFDYNDIYDDNKSKLFHIIFYCILKNKDLNLSFVFISTFECNDYITEDFKKSTFPKINAPAIVFPFVRSFVSNFFINSGFNNYYLPSYNFVEINKIRNKEDNPKKFNKKLQK